VTDITQLPPIVTMKEVSSIWLGLEECRHWPELEWAMRCVERPEAVLIGGGDDGDGGETFAVLDVNRRRVLTEEEFPSSLFHDGGLRWRDVPAG
jgi:hypothetical protein